MDLRVATWISGILSWPLDRPMVSVDQDAKEDMTVIAFGSPNGFKCIPGIYWNILKLFDSCPCSVAAFFQYSTIDLPQVNPMTPAVDVLEQ